MEAALGNCKINKWFGLLVVNKFLVGWKLLMYCPLYTRESRESARGSLGQGWTFEYKKCFKILVKPFELRTHFVICWWG